MLHRWQKTASPWLPGAELGADISVSHGVGTSPLRSVSDRLPRPSCPCFSAVTWDPKAPQMPPEGEAEEVLSLLPAEGGGNYD